MIGTPRDVPGAELVRAGIEALDRGELTVEALLVAVGRRRLRAAGLTVPEAPPIRPSPEIALYEALGARHPHDAHARYNGLIRRLVSFERALEVWRSGKCSPGAPRNGAVAETGQRPAACDAGGRTARA